MRRRFVRLDRLVLGANPCKLPSRVIPAATGASLTDKERVRLQELNDKMLYGGPLTHEEKYERERLRGRERAR